MATSTFRQAGETPLSTLEWKHRFVDETTQENILNGVVPTGEEFPEECEQIMEYMKTETNIQNSVTHETTFEEFKQFLKKAKEKSACSPSGRTYSHYKMLLDDEDHNILISLSTAGLNC